MEWIAGIVVLVLLLFKGGGKGTGGKELPGDPNKPGGDTPEPTPDTPPTGPKPKPKPGTPTIPKSVNVFGDVKNLPSWFDTDGNSFWISPNCDQIAEGPLFLPLTGQVAAHQEPTLAETLAARPNGKINSAWGFVDYLVDVEGYTSATAIAVRFIEDFAPLCADVPYPQWPQPLKDWADDFAARILEHVEAIVYGGNA